MAGGRELVDIRETGTESPEDPDLCKLHGSELKATTDKIMWVHNLGHDGSNSKAPLALSLTITWRRCVMFGAGSWPDH